MDAKKLLVYVSFGTYGRDDDAFGALLAANSALAKGMEVAIVLVENGVCMAKKGQVPGPIGFPNNLDELNDFVDLDGKLVVSKEALEQRGISETELLDSAQIVKEDKLSEIINKYDLTLTF
jgi:tRNA 2-thiouridine synthesizing protein D